MSGWRARRAQKKRLKELQKQRAVEQEKCYLCGTLVTVDEGLEEQAIRPAFPTAKGALSRVHVCSACIRRVTVSYGTVDERACLWLTIPEAKRCVAWLRGETPSAERGAEQPAAVTQQPSPPPPPAVVEEPPLEEGWGFALSKFAALERRLDARLAALERREPHESGAAVAVMRKAQPPPKPRPATPPPKAEKRDIALDIAEVAATILHDEGDMDAPTLRARLPPEAQDKLVWGRVVLRLTRHPTVVVSESNGVKLFSPKRR